MAPPTDSGAGVKMMDPSTLFFSPDEEAANDVEREIRQAGAKAAQRTLLGNFDGALNILPSPPKIGDHIKLQDADKGFTDGLKDGVDLGGHIKLEFPSLQKYSDPLARYEYEKEVMVGRWWDIENIKPPKEPMRAPRVRLPPPKNWPISEIEESNDHWTVQLVKSNVDLAKEVVKKTMPFVNKRSHAGYSRGEELEEDEADRMKVLNLSYQDLTQQYHLDEFHQKLTMYWRVRVLTLTDNGLKNLSMFEFPRVEALYLDRNDFREISKLPSCPRLQVLKLSFNEIWYDGLEGLAEYPVLQELVLRGCPVAQERDYVLWVSSYGPRSLKYLDDKPIERKTCFRGRRAMRRLFPCLPSAKTLMFWKNVTQAEPDEDWEVQYARKLWADYDEDGSGTLDVDEVVKLVDALNLDVGSNYVQYAIDQANKDGNNTLSFEELMRLLRLLRMTPMMMRLFKHYSHNSVYLKPNDFQAFLHSEQGEDPFVFQASTVRQLIHNIQPAKKKAKKKAYLYPSGFSTYMRSYRHNDALDPNHYNKYSADMTQSLPNYFISSSHNSYLVTDHLEGSGSTLSVQEAFVRHAKCIKLDVFNGDNGKPQVRHMQGSPDSSVPFADVLAGIPDFAFIKSPFPVILILEVHCDIQQQELMALQILEHLGAFLQPNDTPLSDGRKPPSLPSPDDLRGRILIKLAGVDEDSVVSDDIAVDKGATYFPKGAIARRAKLEQTLKGGKGDRKRSEMAMSKHNIKDLLEARMNTKKPTAVVNSDLLALANFRSFYIEDLNSMNHGQPHDVLTLDEDELDDLTDEKRRILMEWAKHRLVILEPRASRIGATSQDPFVGWQLGIQMVSMGFHLLADEFSQMNAGRFRVNHGAGYLPKPQCMGDKIEYFNPRSYDPPKYSKLVMRVMSGHELPRVAGRETINPFVRVQVKGFKQDEVVHRTATVQNNGFNPVYEEKFTLPLKLAELDVVRMTVVDENPTCGEDIVVGEASLPATSIRAGYRHVGVKDMNGNWIQNGCLIVHFEWSEIENDSFAPGQARRATRKVYPGELPGNGAHSLAAKALKTAGSTVSLPDGPASGQQPVVSPRNPLRVMSPRELLSQLKDGEKGEKGTHAAKSGLVKSLQAGRQDGLALGGAPPPMEMAKLQGEPGSSSSLQAAHAMLGSFESIDRQGSIGAGVGLATPQKAMMGDYKALTTGRSAAQNSSSGSLAPERTLLGRGFEDFTSARRNGPGSDAGTSTVPKQILLGDVGGLPLARSRQASDRSTTNSPARRAMLGNVQNLPSTSNQAQSIMLGNNIPTSPRR